MASRNNELTVEEIEERMKADGFPEMEWLWKRFLKLGISLSDIDYTALKQSRVKHMEFIISHPFIMIVLSILVASWEFIYLWGMLLSRGWTSAGDLIMAGLLSPLTVYLFWFAVTVIQRIFIHSWKNISALDLAAMLKQRNYLEWLNHTEDAADTSERLRGLGVNDIWDNPGYRVWYNRAEGTIEKTEAVSETEFVQNTLREVLGSKQDRKFRQGRYVDSLKSRKKSVTRFINDHKEAINKNKEGALPVDEGVRLLQELKDAEIIPDSAGERFLEDAIFALKGEVFLPKGVVEAFVWTRDPWKDLTHSRDFYSSASLRGDGFMDMLERRSKGMLGPFGYLRNKSICALDFRTVEGRSVRARLAAAVYKGRNGEERPLLFVDAVEGRFDIKPALIREAVEDYAGACGFNMVLYYRFPLNQVPRRFVKHLTGSDASLGELEISYADASSREYLDVFGFPFEPFEYAYPRGKVIGYIKDTGGGMNRDAAVPGRIKVAFNMAKARGLLWLMVFSSLACSCWMIYRFTPDMLLPAGIIAGVVIVYNLFIHNRLRGRVIGAELNV